MYRPLRILTARPTHAEEAAAAHALYGVLAAEESSSVARWLNMVVPVIRSAWREGKLPLLVGGTGMYLKALMEGLAEVPEIPPEVRERVRNSLPRRGRTGEGVLSGKAVPHDAPLLTSPLRGEEIHASPSLHARLLEKDPEMAARLKPGDTQRILRALEVVEATGKSLRYFQCQPVTPPLPKARFHLFMTEFPRTEIYRRIDARFLKMVEEGALEEVRQLVAGGKWQVAGNTLPPLAGGAGGGNVAAGAEVASQIPPLTSPPQAGGISKEAQAGGIREGAQAVMDNRLPRTIPLRQGFGGQAHQSPLFKAHGVPELLAHLRGEMALEEAIRRAQQNTRHYAKRQTTWLRNQFPKARPVASAKEIFASIDGSG